MAVQAPTRKTSFCKWLGAASILASLICAGKAAPAAFVEPAVFASEQGVLDIRMIAKPKPIPSISFAPRSGSAPINPIGWVYEICRRPASGDDCPAGAGTVADYGGVRLALQQGDTLKIRLINRLPKIDPAKLTHADDPGQGNLYLNPTNLHTHGLLVPARAPTPADPSFGDYIFVSVFNSGNGIPQPQTHAHGAIAMDAIEYRIDIPKNHPSGLFWFHPHLHGLALNQVSSGLAGIITIGNVGDYASGDAMRAPFPEAQVRHLVLKDIQVLAAGTIKFEHGSAAVADGEVLNQEDPDFCAQFPADASEVRHGSCPGTRNSDGNDYTGSQWYFTLNGEPYPTIRMANPNGEVWRLINASGSLSYDLHLIDEANGMSMVMQLLAVDGVSVHLPQNTPMATMVELAGARFKMVDCPLAPSIDMRSLPVCVTELVMMPSARAEVWVTYRTPDGRVAPGPRGATASFRMVGLTMGTGDKWPAFDLAKVEFAAAGSPNLVSSALDIQGDALAVMQPTGIFGAPVRGASPAPSRAGCKALANGHRRRIFFGLEDVAEDGSFALGYEEIDEQGAVVPGTQRPLTRFDPWQNVICLPLGPGQMPVHETWELVQLSTENHNFHIHQTRFRIVGGSSPPSAGLLQDNIPLGVAVPHIPDVMEKQNGACTPDQWREGQCSSTPTVVDIPFAQLGEFVYHCHILEHEDGGMMAKIWVVPSPN
jgi:L-ascorbate oxidase